MASTLPSKFVLPLGLEICLLVSHVRTSWENALDEVIDAAILILNEELREILRKKRRKHCTIAFNFIVVIGMSDIPKTFRSSYTSKNVTPSSLLHLDTIFYETAMQIKHVKGGGEHLDTSRRVS